MTSPYGITTWRISFADWRYEVRFEGNFVAQGSTPSERWALMMARYHVKKHKKNRESEKTWAA